MKSTHKSLMECHQAEITARKQLVKQIREVEKSDGWKTLGFKSMKEFCEGELGYDEFQTRDIMIEAGKIMTADQLTAGDPAIRKNIEKLKVWRKKQAAHLDWSAYLVLTNRTLMAIAKSNPRQLEELAEIPGVGPTKIEKFGRKILSCLASAN